jgi:hypothetical protein
MNLSFQNLDETSSWEMRSREVMYCPLNKQEYTVTRRLWPSMCLEDNHFRIFVN